MMIKITAMNAQGVWHSFSIHHHDLETVYEVLHTIVQKGEILVNVTLIDEKGYLPLPLGALEQGTFSNPIESIRQQWEAILTQPVRQYLSKDEFKQNLIGLQQDRLASIRRILSHTQTLLERTHKLSEGVEKDKLINHYMCILDRYSRYLIRLETDIAWLDSEKT